MSHIFVSYSRKDASFVDRLIPELENAGHQVWIDRLGITGARWDLPGAEAVLKLRALHSSGDWKTYWRFHQQQEAARNYAQAA